MSTIFELKEQAVTDTPLLLFDCVLAGGQKESWSTHRVINAGRRTKRGCCSTTSSKCRRRPSRAWMASRASRLCWPTRLPLLRDRASHGMEGRAAHGGISVLRFAQRSARERDPGSVSGDMQPSGRDTGGDVPDHGDQPDEPAKSADAAGPDTETMPLELSGECGAAHGSVGRRKQREILSVLPVRVLGGIAGGAGNLNGGAPFTSCAGRARTAKRGGCSRISEGSSTYRRRSPCARRATRTGTRRRRR